MRGRKLVVGGEEGIAVFVNCPQARMNLLLTLLALFLPLILIYYNRTQVKTEARIISELKWGLTGRVEAFGINKFMDNSAKARKGMAHILERLRQNAALAAPATAAAAGVAAPDC
jgi:hypothetical protein